jgi:hypothetical protein
MLNGFGSACSSPQYHVDYSTASNFRNLQLFGSEKTADGQLQIESINTLIPKKSNYNIYFSETEDDSDEVNFFKKGQGASNYYSSFYAYPPEYFCGHVKNCLASCKRVVQFTEPRYVVYQVFRI